MYDHILLVAGETSGDLHGAELIKELRILSPDMKFFGIGGENMKNSGVEILYHSNQLNFMGFVEIIKYLPFIRKVKEDLISEVIRRKTKYAILIDYPGFNLSIAKRLKDLNVKIFYYISPQVWAWGQSRVTKIKNFIYKMFVVFPFEEIFYKNLGIDAEYVGHPLITKINEYKFLDKKTLFEKFNLDFNKEILLLLPGSRKQEVSLIFPEIYPAAKKLSYKFNMQIVVACSTSINESFIQKITPQKDYIIIKGHTYDLLKHSKFGIIKSGTSTLEAGLLGLPMIIVYKANFLSYLIGRILIKVNNIGIVNILLEKSLIPELIQKNLNERNIIEQVSNLLSDEKKLDEIKEELKQIGLKLGTKNASKIVAEKIILSF